MIARQTDPLPSHLAAAIATEKEPDRMRILHGLVLEFPHQCQMYYAWVYAQRHLSHLDPFVAGMIAYNSLTPTFKPAEKFGLIRPLTLPDGAEDLRPNPWTKMDVQVYEAVNAEYADRLFVIEEKNKEIAKQMKKEQRAREKREKLLAMAVEEL